MVREMISANVGLGPWGLGEMGPGSSSWYWKSHGPSFSHWNCHKLEVNTTCSDTPRLKPPHLHRSVPLFNESAAGPSASCSGTLVTGFAFSNLDDFRKPSFFLVTEVFPPSFFPEGCHSISETRYRPQPDSSEAGRGPWFVNTEWLRQIFGYCTGLWLGNWPKWNSRLGKPGSWPLPRRESVPWPRCGTGLDLRIRFTLQRLLARWWGRLPKFDHQNAGGSYLSWGKHMEIYDNVDLSKLE